MLRIGEVLRNAYANPLQLYYYPSPYQSAASRLNASLTFQTENIVMYSTKYRRTFQSAMALFFTLLPKELWNGLQVHESHSLSFCFADCACQRAEILKTRLEKNASKSLDQHVTMQSIVTWVGSSLLQNPAHSQLMPLEIRDAALSLICHNAQLPCRRSVGENAGAVKLTTTVKPVENSDFINIDQDYNNNNNNNNGNSNNNNNQQVIAVAAQMPAVTEDENDSSNEIEPEPEGCVEQSHIMALMTYNNWQAAKEMRSRDMRTQGLLRAYGLLRHIVNYMLKIISGEKIKLVLYSGHDKTMQSVQAALGLHRLLEENPFVPYGSRLVFEVYRSINKDIEYYFRLLYNGVDVTNQIHICEAGKSLRVNRGRKQKADLCPIENIIRFIHDDYFNSLNVTNFRDACLPTNKVDDFL
jgi:2-phosphoxylose phosphatase